MNYSDKLNGYWEEGYHYYIEIRDGRMTVRGYRRDVVLETEISYDADAVERGERTVITPKESVLSRDFEGKPFTMIKELAWESGELKFLYYYTIMGETLYTLRKTDKGPFDHIIIRDDEFLPKLQGEWVEWSRSGKSSNTLVIKGDRLSTFGIEDRKIHVVSYTYNRDEVRIVPANLIDTDFGSWQSFEVGPDRLTSRMMVFDASVPLSVFARREMLDRIEIPAAAKEPMRSTMTFMGTPASGSFAGLAGMMMMTAAGAGEEKTDVTGTTEPGAGEGKDAATPSRTPKFCPECGSRITYAVSKFCSECGSRL
jgi:hypothetical protein